MSHQIPSQLSPGDTKTLRSVMQMFSDYAYLEIGSYLGGSLHFHLTNPKCLHAWSVDTRQTGQIRDERNIPYAYSATTRHMLDIFAANNISTARLTTVDGTIADVPNTQVDLIFVDGEHTNSAVYSDAKQCLRFNPSVILFHDDWIVFTGIEQAAAEMPEYTLLKLAGSDISALVANRGLDQFKLPTEDWATFTNNAKSRMEQYENTKTNLH